MSGYQCDLHGQLLESNAAGTALVCVQCVAALREMNPPRKAEQLAQRQRRLINYLLNAKWTDGLPLGRADVREQLRGIIDDTIITEVFEGLDAVEAAFARDRHDWCPGCSRLREVCSCRSRCCANGHNDRDCPFCEVTK